MANRLDTNVGLRIFLLAMEEVLGKRGVATMLNAAGLRQHIQIALPMAAREIQQGEYNYAP